MHSTETVNAPLSKRPVRVLNFFSSDRLGGVVIPRFVIVGSVAAAADVGLYTLLVGLASDPSAAFFSWDKNLVSWVTGGVLFFPLFLCRSVPSGCLSCMGGTH